MAMETAVSIARAERERVVDDAIHSGEMEGLTVTDETRADADEYVVGHIDSDELVKRVRARGCHAPR
jgi:hypothetical protein